MNIKFTTDQSNQLNQLFLNLVSGGAVIAQVYPDGMVVTSLTPDDTLLIQEALVKTGRRRTDRRASTLDERLSFDSGLKIVLKNGDLSPTVVMGRTTGGWIGQP